MSQYLLDGELKTARKPINPLEIPITGIPQSTANPLLDVFGEPDYRDDHEKAMDTWRQESFTALDAAVIDPKSYGDERVPHGYTPDEWRKTRVVDDWMRLHSDGEEPPMGLSREFTRARLAERVFGGAGAENDDALYGEITKAATGRKNVNDLGRELKVAAFDDAMLPGDKAPGYAAFREKLKAHAGYNAENEADYAEAWHANRREANEKIGPFRKQLDEVWNARKNGGEVTPETLASIPDEDLPEFLKALRLRAETLGDKEKETFLAGMRKDFARTWEGAGGRAMDTFAEAGFAISKDGKALDEKQGFGFAPGEWQASKEGSETARNRAHEVRRIMSSTFDPIDYVDGWGWAQKIPGVTTTSLSYAVPGVGTAFMISSIEGMAQEKAYLNARSKGMDEKAAGEYSSAMGAAAVIPQAILEKIGIGIWSNKIPALTGMLRKMDDAILNRGLRFATKTGTTGALETGVELTQDVAEMAVTDIAHALNSDVPDVDWNTELKGAWNSIPEIFGSMIVLSMFGAAGGLNAEARQAAFARSSTTELEAFGIAPEGIAAIQGAQGPASLSSAIEAAMETRDPNSETAQSAVGALKLQLETQRRAQQNLENLGYAAPSFVQSAEGITVFDGEGKELGSAPDLSGAVRIARAHTVALDDMEADQVAALGSLMEAAKAAVDLDPYSTVEVNLGAFDPDTASPEMAARFAAQVALKEQAEGGTGDIARSVLGYSVTEMAQGVRQTVNRIFRGAAVTDVFHETFHGLRRQERAAGTITRADELAMLRALDTVLAGKMTKDGVQLRFIPENMTDDQVSETLLDEAFSEIAEMEILRTRKKDGKGKLGLTRGVISRNLTALTKLIPGVAGKWTAFMNAVRARWGLSLSRAIAMKKAERDGTFDKQGYDAYLDKILGLDQQAEHDAGVKSEFDRILGLPDEIVDDDIPFSIGKAVDAEYLSLAQDPEKNEERLTELITAARAAKGYSKDDSHKLMHQAPNASQASDDGSSGVVSLANLKNSELVPADYWTRPDWYLSTATERESHGKIKKAMDGGKIRVYRTIPATAKDEKIRNGDWVTPSRAYAVESGHDEKAPVKVISTLARPEQLFWDGNSADELGFDDGKNYVYKNTKNNRKLADLVTYQYDDDGNRTIIPLSKRFNYRDSSASFSIGRGDRPLFSATNVQDLRHDKTAWLDGDADTAGANDIVSKYYKTAAFAGIPKDALLVAMPSTSGRNILPFALANRISKDFGQEIEKRPAGTATAKGEAKNKRTFFDKEADPVAFVPNAEVLADLQGKRVFITEDVHNTGESWIAFARMLMDNGVQVLGVATLVSTEQRITSPRDIERLSEKVAAATGKGIDEVLPAMHSLFDGTFKQLFNKAEAEVSRSNTRRNAENSGKLFDIASSGRRAGAYSNPLQSGDGSGGEVLGGDGLNQGTFGFSIGPAQVADIMAGNALKRITDPRRRTQVMSRIARDFGNMRLQIERMASLSGIRRSKGDLRREAMAREDLRAEELIGEVHARFGSLAFDEDLFKIKSQPVHEYLSDPSTPLRGRLMSKAQAIKNHPDQYQLHREGHYDGSDGVSRAVFGGIVHPGDAAQNLFDEGLISEPTADAMWKELLKEQASVVKNKDALVAMQQQIREAKAQAKQEANEWLATQGKDQEVNFSDKEEIRRSLRMLDAILLALPPEIRGKIGGYTQISMIGTDEARLGYLKDKLAKADKELETFLRVEYAREWEDLLRKAAPQTNEAGQRPTGSIAADAYDIFRVAESAMGMSFAEGEAEADKWDAIADHPDTEPKDVDMARVKAQMIRLTMNWHAADAARREQAVLEGEKIYYNGLLALKVEASRRRERLGELRDSAVKGTGKTGHRMEREAAKQATASKLGAVKAMAWEFLSFGQVVNVLFGEKSAAAQWFNSKEIAASNAAHDGFQAKANALESLFDTLSGNRFDGEKLRHRMATDPRIKVQDVLGVDHTFTESQAITFLLMYRQEDGKRHLQGLMDEDGNILSEWAWDDKSAATIDAGLSPEGRAAMAFLGSSYGEEYGRINDVFRRIWNVSMPRHKMYAPLSVKPVQGKGDTIMDPVSGDTMGAGMTPGSLKNRSFSAIAEPDFKDAFQVYLTHARQMEHFIAYAEFSRDALAVVNRRETRNAIEAAGGADAAGTLSKWIDYFALGGVHGAAMGGAWTKILGGMLGRLSQAAIVGRVSVLCMQSMQLAAASFKMPTGAFLTRFAKLSAGRLQWGDTIGSEYIQRRMQQLPPVVRDMMQGMASGTPNRAKYLAGQAGRTSAGADALFTAGAYAMFYDYHLGLARKAGIANPEAHAHSEAERLTDQVAQPVRTGARSWLEVANAGNPAFRAAWNFSSDPRQKMSLLVYAAMRRDTSGKEKAADVTFTAAKLWIIGGVMQTLMRTVLRDLRNDDDDEIFDERYWSPARLALQVATGPLGAVPFLGGMMEDATYKLTGQFAPQGGMLSFFAEGGGMLNRWSKGKVEPIKDLETLTTAGAGFSGTSAAAASAMHIIRDVVGFIENLEGPD